MVPSTGRGRSRTHKASLARQQRSENDDDVLVRRTGGGVNDYADDNTKALTDSSSSELFLSSWFSKTVAIFFGETGAGVVAGATLLMLIPILLSLCLEGDNVLGSFASQLTSTNGMTENDIDILLDRTIRFGERQKAKGNQMAIGRVQQMLRYMESSEEFAILPTTLQQQCRNRHELCCFWAAHGECPSIDDETSSSTTTLSFMATHCAPACQICQRLDREQRCRELASSLGNYITPALEKSGDLNRLFERIVGKAGSTDRTTVDVTNGDDHLSDQVEESSNREQHNIDHNDIVINVDLTKPTEFMTTTTTNYTLQIHSSPGGRNINHLNDKGGDHPFQGQDQHPAPWVITLDNFLTDDECDALIRHGHGGGGQQQQQQQDAPGDRQSTGSGFERSVDVGRHSAVDGKVYGRKSEVRTSETSWCTTESGCRTAEIPQRIHHRISTLLGIPPQHSEDFQILKYEVGQYYKTHHDYIPHQKTRLCGPRILTILLYLSNVPAGGGTNFPDWHNLTIQPLKGRALLFANVMDGDPLETDPRMKHQALPVLEGTKYAANAWYHLYDYQKALEHGCN